MKFGKQSLLGLAGIALAASAHAGVVFTESFDNFASTWTLTNNSTAPNLAWGQGNPGVMTSQSGAANSYAYATYNSAGTDTGSIANWLISPEITLGSTSTLSFYLRSEPNVPGFLDTVNVFFNAGSSTATASFTTLLGSLVAPISGWTLFTLNVPTAGTGRIAFEYISANASTANVVGIDTMSVSTPTVGVVPEPSTYALMALGLAGLALVRRRRSAV